MPDSRFLRALWLRVRIVGDGEDAAKTAETGVHGHVARLTDGHIVGHTVTVPVEQNCRTLRTAAQPQLFAESAVALADAQKAGLRGEAGGPSGIEDIDDAVAVPVKRHILRVGGVLVAHF